MTVYCSPEKYGLTPIGEIEWGDACYSFDLTVVWRRDADGALVWADDSGCSCPAPFEDVSESDPAAWPAGTREELQADLEQRNNGGKNWAGDRSAEIADLMIRVVETIRTAA